MALVAEAVDHFFHPPHQSVEHSETSSRSCTPRSRSGAGTPQADQFRTSSRARSDGSMSQPSTGAALSQSSQHDMSSRNKSQREASVSHIEKTSSNAATPSSKTDRPGSPPLAAQSAPSNDMPLPGQAGASARNTVESLPSSDTFSEPGTIDSSSSQKIRVRDLAHIQTLATADADGQIGGQRSKDGGPQYEISGMPIENIIEMVAGLLTKITTTNDVQHEHLHRQMPPPESSSHISSQTSSVLAFHGKNVPSITICCVESRV